MSSSQITGAVTIITVFVCLFVCLFDVFFFPFFYSESMPFECCGSCCYGNDFVHTLFSSTGISSTGIFASKVIHALDVKCFVAGDECSVQLIYECFIFGNGENFPTVQSADRDTPMTYSLIPRQFPDIISLQLWL